MHARRRFFALCLAGPALAGCAAERIPATARLPRPERVYVEDFQAPAAAVLVDTNQFSYVMEGFAMPRDARARQADAAAAQAAIRATLLTALRDMGFAVAATPPPPDTRENTLIISGDVTNITEAIPSDLATFAIGEPASQVNTRSVVFYQLAGQAPRPWQDFITNAPVTPAAPEEMQTFAGTSPASGAPLTYLAPERADSRTREVAAQARRLALRLAARLRASFAAEGWISPAPMGK